MTKLTKLRAELKAKSVDALIVLDELNQHYLSDFAFTDGLLVITAKRASLITDFRYYEMAEKKASREFDIVMPENRFEYINKMLSDESVKVVGFEGGFVPYNTYVKYKENLSSYTFVDIDNTIEKLREIKSPEELSIMANAQDITDAAFSHILKTITTDMTEIEVAAELEYFMRRAGADGVAFDTIAVSGDASALPHGTPRNVKLKSGFLTMDYGAKLSGYCSDMTRTIVIGKADADIKKLYNTVLSAQSAALEYIKEGADCGEADRIAREIIDKDYQGAFGHSVGLYIHESPRLAPGSNPSAKLVTGNVVTFEPGIYIPEKYGCRIEDMAAITDTGIRNFTKSTKELIELF